MFLRLRLGPRAMAFLAALCLGTICRYSSAGEPLTKEKLLALVEAHVDPSIIVSLIQKDCVSFDLDADTLLELNKKVPSQVLKASIECKNPSKSAATSPSEGEGHAEKKLPKVPDIDIQSFQREVSPCASYWDDGRWHVLCEGDEIAMEASIGSGFLTPASLGGFLRISPRGIRFEENQPDGFSYTWDQIESVSYDSFIQDFLCIATSRRSVKVRVMVPSRHWKMLQKVFAQAKVRRVSKCKDD